MDTSQFIQGKLALCKCTYCEAWKGSGQNQEVISIMTPLFRYVRTIHDQTLALIHMVLRMGFAGLSKCLCTGDQISASGGGGGWPGECICGPG